MLRQRVRKETYEKRRALLKYWTIEDNGQNSDLCYRLAGDVYGHPSFKDGETISTSPLLRIDIPAHTAETINTVYLLG